MLDLQQLVNNLNEVSRQQRSRTQLTLGGMIETLQGMHGDTIVQGIDVDAGSYRGYYSDLAFEPSNTGTTVKALLEVCIASNGKTFDGYKGGDFLMADDTPVWLSKYGTTGDKLMSISTDGVVETEDDTVPF